MEMVGTVGSLLRLDKAGGCRPGSVKDAAAAERHSKCRSRAEPRPRPARPRKFSRSGKPYKPLEAYNTSSNSTRRRGTLLGCAIGLMKVPGELSSVLTSLPASDETPNINAGVTFAMPRSTESFAPDVDAASMLLPRFDDLQRQIPQLGLPGAVAEKLLAALGELGKSLVENGKS